MKGTHILTRHSFSCVCAAAGLPRNTAQRDKTLGRSFRVGTLYGETIFPSLILYPVCHLSAADCLWKQTQKAARPKTSKVRLHFIIIIISPVICFRPLPSQRTLFISVNGRRSYPTRLNLSKKNFLLIWCHIIYFLFRNKTKLQ